MIIGVNLSHDYAHCIIDGDFVFVHEEERSSRKRYHWDSSSYTLATLDRYSSEQLSKVKAIYLSYPRLLQLRQRGGDLSSPNRMYRYLGDYPGLSDDRRIGYGSLLVDGLEISAALVSHYHAHAYASFYSSGFEDADILCIDGGGDFGEGALLRMDGTKIRLVHRFLNIQIGSSYHHFARRFFQADTGFYESKLMAVSGFGKSELCENEFLNQNGRLNSIGPSVRPSVHDVALFQRRFQDFVLKLIDSIEHSSKNLCCSGGVFYNVLLNKVIAESGVYKNVFVPPHVGDMGTALGAALMAAEETGVTLDYKRIRSPFLGADIDLSLHELCAVIQHFGDVAVPLSDDPGFDL